MPKTKISLLAFPRTGSTFLRLVIAYLTKTQPGQCGDGHVETAMHSLIDFEFTNKDTFAFQKFHWMVEVERYGNFIQDSKLILLVRDPIEVAGSCRLFFANEKICNITVDKTMQPIKKYEHLVKFFTEAKNEKYVMLYDSVMQDFENEVRKLADFLGVPCTDEDIEKLTKMRQSCLKMKSKGERCPSKGIRLRYYFESLGPSKRRELLIKTAKLYSQLEKYGLKSPIHVDHYWKDEDGKGYGTHCPILYKILTAQKGPTLELGGGEYSTRMLSDLLHNEIFATLEPNQKWYQKMVEAKYHQNESHSVIHVTDWKKVFSKDSFVMKNHWFLIFIDHDGSRRVDDAIRLKDQCDLMVLHDTDADGNGGKYGWKKLWEHFKYKKDFGYGDPRKKPATSLVSNTIDVNKWWKENVEKNT